MSIDLSFTDTFAQRHIGPTDADVDAMLDTLGVESLDALVDATIPNSIRTDEPLDLPPARTEQQVLADAQERGAGGGRAARRCGSNQEWWRRRARRATRPRAC